MKTQQTKTFAEIVRSALDIVDTRACQSRPDAWGAGCELAHEEHIQRLAQLSAWAEARGIMPLEVEPALPFNLDISLEDLPF